MLADLSPNYEANILLVEDDAYVAKFIARRLEKEGLAVECLSNGAEALQRLTRGPLPDLIITDLCMPELGGLQLLRATKDLETAQSIPFIVLSGAGDIDERVQCLDSGASDYLAKPINGAELAARVRVQLRNTQELRRLRQEARFDPLTGCLNRRGAIEALQREVDRSRRSGTPLTLMLIDADRFKDINDTYGHAAGDVVLMEIASTLRECLRLTDVVGRLGGDEFVVALPNVGEPLASEIRLRLRDRVGRNCVPGTKQHISISIGIAVDAHGRLETQELFEDADRAMYADKSRRRRPITALVSVGPEGQGLGSQP